MEKLTSSIDYRLYELLNNTKYQRQELLDFYLSIQDNAIEPIDLIIAYYFAVNDEYDVLKIKEEVLPFKDLIDNYIGNIHNYIIISDFNKYSFDLSPFSSTPLSSEKYRKVLIGVFKSIITANVRTNLINSAYGEIAELKVIAKLDSSDLINEINRKYCVLRKEYNKLYASVQQEIDALSELTSWLSKAINCDKTIYCPTDIISKIHDDEIIYNLHRVIACLNNDYLVNIYKKHKELLSNNVSYLRHLFKNSVNVSNIPNNCIKIISEYGNIDDIINILKWLSSIKINIIDFRSKEGMIALVNTNIEMIYSIYELIQNGVISGQFVLRNPDVLYDDNIINGKNIGHYSEAMKKYVLLKQYDFNLENTNVDEILLLDANHITTVINQFNSYGLNKNKGIHKNMFTNKRFFNYIDLFIELGMYDYIKDNFNIIGDDCNNIIKRIYISKMMRLSVFDSFGNLLPRVITGNDFYIANDALDNYIISASNQMIDSNILGSLNDINEVSNEFDYEIVDFDRQFALDDVTYKFNNILISRNKVLRNYNNLRRNYPNYDRLALLESSIIHNSILDIPDVYNIKDLFDDFCSIKQKKI